MPKEDWVANPVHAILSSHGLWPFETVGSVLDVACGLSLKSKFLGAKHVVGVDIYEPYLKAIECETPYSVVRYDVRKLSDIFLDHSFDVVYALDIIEHLEKEEALDLIDQCKRIARHALVIETPKGYVPQNIDIQGFGGDTWQTHRSGWEVAELEALGFQCIVRPYTMCDVRRHTDLDVSPSIELIDAIYFASQ